MYIFIKKINIDMNAFLKLYYILSYVYIYIYQKPSKILSEDVFVKDSFQTEKFY